MTLDRARRTSIGSGWLAIPMVLILSAGGCTLEFPIEWLEGECGDGYVGQGEQCDDGDTNAGDGCSDTCTEEPGFDCTGVPSVCVSTCGDGELASDEQCDDGNTLPGDGCDADCNTEIQGCGDGEIQTGQGETCDDGNQTALDGCSDLCVVEDGWDCNGAPSICVEICGDGSVVGTEAMSGGCDDGNVLPNDGCNANCEVEVGYTCNGEPSVCTAGCGDGTLVPGVEACDDGNNTDDDGCAFDCQVEGGWTCNSASPSVCSAICGDGTVVGDEAATGGCDDGNTADGDGCAADCTEEPGFDCSGEPSTCTTTCGDGIQAGAEACDDGDTLDCNGGTCRGDCSAEETGCGDGFICGSEQCDDGNTDWGDGCGGTCIEEANWDCTGEPSVCTVPCDNPLALFMQSGCNAGDMCTVTSFSGGSYVCVAEGSNPYYGSCTGYLTCQAGSACDNLGYGLTCFPYCDVNDPTWVCPLNGTELATCAYFYPQGQTVNGICAPNECDTVDQTGCSSGWCDLFRDGVSFCEPDPPGTVGLHGGCVQGSTNPAEMCVPGMLCINTGSDECLSYCHIGGTDCTVPGEFCVPWSANDPVYGVCQ